MNRLNTRLTNHIESLSKTTDNFRKKLKLIKERERRDKEAADAILREHQDIEDARHGILNIHHERNARNSVAMDSDEQGET
jgi:hypothetical protein